MVHLSDPAPAADDAQATTPGAAPHIDATSQLHCPRCDSTDLTLTSLDELKDPTSTWITHHVTCTACDRDSELTLVSAFGHVHARWL